MQLFARTALLPEGWASDVLIDVDTYGRIDTVAKGAACPVGLSDLGLLLPAPVNAHSHAFQRAMAGLTEHRGPSGADSFWTWRQLMYRFLDRLTPTDVEAITAFVQMEMLEAGYGASVEFHYLHHQPDGSPYAALAEMSERVVAAAEQSGIGLTLLPVLYTHGGCDGRALGAGQRRFGNTMARYVKLLEGAQSALVALPPDSALGVAPHSLRAVVREDFADLPGVVPDGPVHMHLAEQSAEVAEVLQHWGARPVEWALDALPLDARWCLVHCTQMTTAETKKLAATGAVAGLCPITEANLGDGIFDGVTWMSAGGAIAIGSDSNIRVSLSEELRTLEYSQRLRDHTRAALATAHASTGRRLFDAMCRGGAQSAGRHTGQIAPGRWADLLRLNADHIDLYGRTGDQILDTFVFGAGDILVTDVWSAGRHLVRDGAHCHRQDIAANYRAALHR